MLAWAVTVHKAQGLTLDRVVFDAGDSEASTGLFFTAVTRVRDPSHLAFQPMPDLERVTEEIASKPKLYARKLHDHRLRSRARLTAVAKRHLAPPQSALADAPPKPMPHRRSAPATQAGSKYGRQANLAFQPAAMPDPQESALARLPPRPVTHRAAPSTQARSKHAREASQSFQPDAATKHARRKLDTAAADEAAGPTAKPASKRPPLYFALPPSSKRRLDDQPGNADLIRRRNWALLRDLGLPAFDTPAGVGSELPAWFARSQFELRARIIDYCPESPEVKHYRVKGYLERLGFEVKLDASEKQLGVSCGIVASNAVAMMMRSPVGWWEADVRDAAAHEHVVWANQMQDAWAASAERFSDEAVAENPLATRFVSDDELARLTDLLVPDKPSALQVTTLDGFVAQLARDLDHVAGGGDDLPVKFCIPNTDFSGSNGAHWFTVAYSIVRRVVK